MHTVSNNFKKIIKNNIRTYVANMKPVHMTPAHKITQLLRTDCYRQGCQLTVFRSMAR
jgi:hypothetical protein